MDFAGIGTVSGYVRALDSRRQAEQRSQGSTEEKSRPLRQTG